MKVSYWFVTVLIITISIMIPFSLQAKSGKKQYSYLPKPPVSIRFAVYPDQEVYERGELVNYGILAQLDTLSCNTDCDYIVYFGNLGNLLTESVLVDSEVQNSYILNSDSSLALISFQVKMLNKSTPPVIEVQTVRKAPVSSINKKPFMGIIIDEYDYKFITSSAYAKVRSSGYGTTD